MIMTTMSETTFQKQILARLDNVERSINQIREHIEDSKLTDEEKQLLQESLRHENEGNLISSKDLKKKLGI